MSRTGPASMLLALFASLGISAKDQKPTAPVGLVLGAGGTVTRDGATGKVKPGEVLFAGDVLMAGSEGIPFLFCPQKLSGVVLARGKVAFEEKEYSGAIEKPKPVPACIIPDVARLPIRSHQNIGLNLTPVGTISAPATPFEQRMQELPVDKKGNLEGELKALQSDDPAMLLARGAILEKAGFLYEASDAYRSFAGTYDEVAWVIRKINGLEKKLKHDQKKQPH